LQLKDDSTDIKNFTWWYGYSDQDTPSTFNLPFVPGGRVNLDNMSLSLNATHPSNNETEYNLHSLFGHSEGKLTSEILTDDSISPLKNKRPFLLSRSTFAGSGQYVQHWLGDNHRTWEDMKASIAGVMNFNMFGIPLVGPDTCGFFGESGQDELCARWVQLATFYPFARQHRDKFGGGDPNEVWRLAEPYKTWARNALFDRLQYVRHMYTCLFDATQSGQTCFDPILFHYPTLDQAFENTEHTFIVGNALKVSPVLEAGVKTTYEAFFPNGRWVSMKKYSDVLVVDDPSGGAN
jgi:alpha-glucosidase (family GH31 glycosyl hydrolase)